MIDEDYKRSLEQRGVVYIPGVVDPDLIRDARDKVHATLNDQGLDSSNRWEKPDAGKQWGSLNYVKRLKNNRQLAAVISPDVDNIATTLAGTVKLEALSAKPQLLYSSPVADEWTVPNTVWHLDFPRLASGKTPGLQVFVCVDQVVAEGGGTLLVSGSHQLFNDQGFIRSRDIKRKMKTLPYFQSLMSPGEPAERKKLLAREVTELGTPLSVVELTGEPGDIYVTDLRMLHTVAPNAGTHPRIVMTQRYVRPDAVTEMLQAHAEKRAHKGGKRAA